MFLVPTSLLYCWSTLAFVSGGNLRTGQGRQDAVASGTQNSATAAPMEDSSALTQGMGNMGISPPPGLAPAGSVTPRATAYPPQMAQAIASSLPPPPPPVGGVGQPPLGVAPLPSIGGVGQPSGESATALLSPFGQVAGDDSRGALICSNKSRLVVGNEDRRLRSCVR